MARRTKLQIIAVDSDHENVRQARERLLAAGLYGTRVVVQQRDLSVTGYPAYFADLIVSRRCLESDLDARSRRKPRHCCDRTAVSAAGDAHTT